MRGRNHIFQFRDTDHGVPTPTPNVSNVTGVCSLFNPTRAVFRNSETEQFDQCSQQTLQSQAGSRDDDVNGDETHGAKQSQHSETSPPRHVAYVWTSRNNRKGRHALAINNRKAFKGIIPDEYLYTGARIRANLVRMVTTFPIHDSSYLLALVFVFGSVVWILTGTLMFLATVNNINLPLNAGSLGAEYVALSATVIFVVANVIQMLEKLNEYRSQCFGWTSQYDENAEGGSRLHLVPSACEHNHANRTSFFHSTNPQKEGNEGNIHVDDSDLQKLSSSTTHRSYQTFQQHTFDQDASRTTSPRSYGSDSSSTQAKPLNQPSSQRARGRHSTSNQDATSWYPSKRDFWLYYIHDISFHACSFQLLGSVVAFVGSILRIPAIYAHLSFPLSIAIVWSLKTASGVFFSVAGALFALETQTKLHIPAVTVIGWYAGVTIVVGGIGFALSAVWGVLSEDFWQYQSTVATIWAALAFLVSSLFQLYESVDKYSVREEKLEDFGNAFDDALASELGPDNPDDDHDVVRG